MLNKGFDNKIKLNLTIGVFEVAFLGFFEKDENGKVHPNYKSIKTFLDLIIVHGNFNGILVWPQNDEQFGHYVKDEGYTKGMFGLLQRGEIDFGWFPAPFHTQSPPGQFTAPVTEDSYYLHSFPRSSSALNQNVIESFSFFTPSTWLTILMIVYVLELIIRYKDIGHLSETILATTIRLPDTLFNQHFMGRSVFRWLQLIMLSICLNVFTAAFNTSTIVGKGDPRVNELSDVVEYDKTPCFFQGISMYELFEGKVTKAYADVYEQAERKGTSKPIPIGSLPDYQEYSAHIVKFESEKAGKIGNSVDGTNHPASEFSYWAPKPFYRSSNAFIFNPRKNTDQLTNRILSLTSKLLQAALVDRLIIELIREVILNLPLDLNRYILYKRADEPNQMHIKFKSLEVEGLKLVFIGLIVLMSIATIFFLIEIIVFKLSKPNQKK